MIATLSKSFTFDAAHCLPRLPAGHKCANLHGHTYRVELICRGYVQENGFVVDYDDIARAWAPLHEQLDHKYLNDVYGLETPSTEHLCAWIIMRIDLPSLVAVRVYESSTTWCEMSTRSA